ncbi:hypothetical protein P7K49_025930 [Saguinus oedipus]|uniref:Uncharacterized protein n=1 Tax=Saguinus oedipus TaxID=9490 RepID=A0ABQ9UIM0_SAGOE|nr:hypothetical protein P7K49_025930 [Saguinus oedipus]
MERGWPPGNSRPGERPAACRRAHSVCDSLDLHGAPAGRAAAAALQAALCAAREQPARPRSVCSGGPEPPPTGARGLLLGLLRPRLGRRDPEPSGPPVSPVPSPAPSPAPTRRSRTWGEPTPRPRPASMTFLEVNRLELAAAEAPGAGLGRAGSAGFLRGAALWSSQRWSVLRGGRGPEGPRRGLAALRKSFSFRLRRGQEVRRSESGLLARPPRARTRSDGDTGSLGAFPSRRDLLGADAPRAAPEPGRPRTAAGLWRLLISRFRRREPAPAAPLWSRRAAAAPELLRAPSGKGAGPGGLGGAWQKTVRGRMAMAGPARGKAGCLGPAGWPECLRRPVSGVFSSGGAERARPGWGSRGEPRTGRSRVRLGKGRRITRVRARGWARHLS